MGFLMVIIYTHVGSFFFKNHHILLEQNVFNPHSINNLIAITHNDALSNRNEYFLILKFKLINGVE